MCNYTFSYLNKEQRTKMIKNIRGKYISEPSTYLRQNIIDEQNVYIQFDDVVELTINYLALNSDFFNTMSKTTPSSV